MAKPELKAEAIRLRVEKRMSLNEIQQGTGASKGVLSLWLRDYPLSLEERHSRWSANTKRLNAKRGAKERPSTSDGFVARHIRTALENDRLDREAKGRIAEAAVLLRLAILGMRVFGPVFYGAKEDWIVGGQIGGKLAKIQVKWAATASVGLPTISLRCSDGSRKHRTYDAVDFDFVVGYDGHSDAAYVLSQPEVSEYAAAVTVSKSSLERWDKLEAFLAP